MRRRDLLLQTLIKVTGQPRAHLEKVLDAIPDTDPAKLKAEVPPAEQRQLEEQYEKEAPGILSWYVEALRTHPELLEDRAQCIQQENAKNSRVWRKR